MQIATLEDIIKARQIIAPVVSHTPTQYSRSISDLIQKKVSLKYENLQMTGSFKIRGATNKISSLTKEERARGIVASSAGNHAQGVALAATRLGVKSIVVMPKSAPIVKVQATRHYGAEVLLYGDAYDDAYERARELERAKGYTFVHPYNDSAIIAGQGTIGLEILEDAPDVDTVIVSIGGGGLISGIATALKAKKSSIKVLGVQPRAANSMFRSFKEKKLVEQFSRSATIADGTAVKKPSAEMLNDYLLRLVDDVVDVAEEEIAEAIVFLLERAKTVVEGSGALPLAALRMLADRLGEHTVLVLSGGNIDLTTIERVVHRGLIKSGRLAEFSVAVEDRPGMLHELTGIFAEQGCNILEVRHDRNQMGVELGGTTIDFIVETSGAEKVDAVRRELAQKGFRLVLS